MEPSMSPQSTCTQPLPSPHTRLFDALELSSTWQLLSIELVQQILDHFITNLLISCRASDMYSTTTNAAILKDAWFNFRRDSLFRCQKHLIERYFYDHWLNHVRFNIYVENHMPPAITYRYGGKYMHAHNFPGIFSPDPQLTPNDNGDPETEKATFDFKRPKRGDYIVEAITSSWHSLGIGGYDPHMATLYIRRIPSSFSLSLFLLNQSRLLTTTTLLSVIASLQYGSTYITHASLPSTWNRLMNATNNGWPPLHIKPPDGTRIDLIELCLEGWEVSNDGLCIIFPWKKLMTMVITRILEIWKMPPVVVDEDDLPLLPPPVDSLLVGWFMPTPQVELALGYL